MDRKLIVATDMMKPKIASHFLENSFKPKQLTLTVEVPASDAQQSVLLLLGMCYLYHFFLVIYLLR